MAKGFSIEVRGLEALQRKLKNPRFVNESLERFGNRAGAHIAGEVRLRTPVDTGRLRSSVTHDLDGSPVHTVRIGSNVEYAPHVEEGSRPHWPPMAALQPWARRHGFPAGRSGAFLVARAISRRGTRGHFMFREGLRASLGTVRRLVRDLGGDIEKAWRRT